MEMVFCILSESSKDNTQNPNQTHYQLTNHLQSNALELNAAGSIYLSGLLLT
jgi:hypothetical protein